MYIDKLDEIHCRLKNISGQFSGILRNYLVYKNGINGDNNLNIVTGSLPPYTKLFINPNHDMSYHISGYGKSYKECMQRFMGEAIERFAGVTSHIYCSNKIFKAAYSDIPVEDKKLPIDVFNFLKDCQLREMHRINNVYWDHGLSSNDVIHWVSVPNFLDDGNKTVLPASIFFQGYTNDGIFTPAFSTGTACHENIFKAMKSSLIEYIQIDAFIKSFYSSRKQTRISFDTLPDNLKKSIREVMGKMYDKYDIVIINFTNDAVIKIPIVGVYLIAKNNHTFPSISFGVQGDFSLDNAIYRGIQEAMAVHEMANNTRIVSPQIFKNTHKVDKFFDLDSNINFYADPLNFTLNKENILQRIGSEESYKSVKKSNICTSEDTKSQLKWLQRKLKEKVKVVGYLDITPPYLKEKNIKVIRTCIPELQHMNFPSFPYQNHPRYKEEVDHVFMLHPMA